MRHHIGIYSGTFDPIHTGHIAFAKEALRLCHLNGVVFLPEQRPREKVVVSSIEDRLALINTAIAHEKSLSALQLSSTQFSTDTTLPELQTIFKDTVFTLLLGSDVVRTFLYRWQDLDVLLNKVSLAIGMRNDDTTEEITGIIHTLENTYGIRIKHTFIYTDHAHMASTHIRSKRQN